MPAGVSEDAVLGGRLRLRQPLRGHRVGHDAILLAAATTGRAGEHAIEFGAGVGAAGLALALRAPRLNITLVDIDHYLCALAAENATLNGLSDRVRVIVADVQDLIDPPFDVADRVLMNPPFNDPRRHNVSPDPHRRRAHVAQFDLLPRWTGCAAALLREGGVLTLIWRADDLARVLSALEHGFGDIAVLPVHPRADAPAIRVLVRAVKGAAWERQDCAALALNSEAGGPTPEAEAVLRGGRALALADLG